MPPSRSEHFSFILAKTQEIDRVNGTPQMKFSPTQEENLQKLFKMVSPYTTSLSYNYIAHRLCELSGYDEFLIKFPLPKSDKQLRYHDEQWKKMYNNLNAAQLELFAKSSKIEFYF